MARRRPAAPLPRQRRHVVAEAGGGARGVGTTRRGRSARPPAGPPTARRVEADAIRDRARAAAARPARRRRSGTRGPARRRHARRSTWRSTASCEPGDHVIATAADHNATLRPLHWLASRGVIDLTSCPATAVGRVDPADDRRGLAARHARSSSARTRRTSPGRCRTPRRSPASPTNAAACSLLDAAQSLGQRALRTPPAIGADIVAAPAHKWLLGTGGRRDPLGPRAGVEIEPLLQGGTGSASDSLEMPDAFADRHRGGHARPAGARRRSTRPPTWLEAADGRRRSGERCRRLAAACCRAAAATSAACACSRRRRRARRL